MSTREQLFSSKHSCQEYLMRRTALLNEALISGDTAKVKRLRRDILQVNCLLRQMELPLSFPEFPF